ncbi:MAG TPA: Do family serine endopeptidase [Burkholderiales bacterium]|nr:Do family serine endopeptidase [Burkholderiales bacterium]
MQLKSTVRVLLATVAVTVLLGAYQILAPLGAPYAGAAVENTAPATEVVSGLPDFTRLVEQYGVAVVNVRMERGPAEPGAGPQQPTPGEPFFDPYGRPMPQPEAPPQRGQGSGFIISADGLILTNAHVVHSAAIITVKLSDKREYEAKVIGVDVPTDVAVLKIDATGLPSVKFGNPAKLKVGEWVLAIGSPFGLENSVTAGIVSAKGRGLPDSNYVPFIQTDVAVNPGNSGGPLFNMRGEVVGINSQIFSRTGGFMGLSFAIPIDVAINVKTQLVETGSVVRGRIGVNIQDVDYALAMSFGMPKPQGALVTNVEAGGPADKAGLRTGDVIVGVAGETLEQFSELPSKIAAIRPGTDTTLQIWRDGKKQDKAVTIGLVEPERVATVETRGNFNENELGLALRNLTPAEREQLNTVNGVVVENAIGAAARAGIRRGDIILGVNDKPVKSVEELQGMVSQVQGGRVALLIQRNNVRTYIPVPVG